MHLCKALWHKKRIVKLQTHCVIPFFLLKEKKREFMLQAHTYI